MGGLIPLGDASRRPARIPVVTILIVLVNALVFVRELMGGEAFVTQWSAIPAQIFSGHHWITILTAMFMHGSWSHITGNIIFLWPFALEIEDARADFAILLS
jgi:membrane associated rhomboid family serine protease